jgi:drug/metabolite transporter (DMT)-like permease
VTNPLNSAKPVYLWFLITLGISAISSASILIRLTDAPALVIAAYRVSLAALLLGPAFVRRRMKAKAPLDRRTLQALFTSGVLLALHFACWIQSLKMTTISSSVALVSTTPLFVALLSRAWLQEQFDRRMMFGILCSVVGGTWVAGSDFRVSGEAFLGDILALLGAGMAAGYLVIGRSARRSVDLTAYAFPVYAAAALTLLAVCAAVNLPLAAYSRHTYSMLLLTALIPQLIGHTTFNWALRYLSPTTVAVLLSGEPIGAMFLAYLIFGETASVHMIVGLVILLAGILLSALSQNDIPKQSQ